MSMTMKTKMKNYELVTEEIDYEDEYEHNE